MEHSIRNYIRGFIAATLIITMTLCMCGCKKNPSPQKTADELWAAAAYTENTELGTGSQTVPVECSIGDKAITFTIHTDSEMLGDALKENDLIDGDDSPYGTYIKKFNGITADYNVDMAYWALNDNGAAAADTADNLSIAPGHTYTLVYTWE